MTFDKSEFFITFPVDNADKKGGVASSRNEQRKSVKYFQSLFCWSCQHLFKIMSIQCELGTRIIKHLFVVFDAAVKQL